MNTHVTNLMKDSSACVAHATIAPGDTKAIPTKQLTTWLKAGGHRMADSGMIQIAGAPAVTIETPIDASENPTGDVGLVLDGTAPDDNVQSPPDAGAFIDSQDTEGDAPDYPKLGGEEAPSDAKDEAPAEDEAQKPGGKPNNKKNGK